MTAYYNEIDPKAAAWLRELIKQGHIAPGDVDTRSIKDVQAADLKGYTQCHFFAGIGVWSYALRLAGWPDDRPVWTGSCPCQPFSSAGKKKAFADERHLWPEWNRLISECKPVVCFGEQVASGGGLAWLDVVHTDLEKAGYAVGQIDLCAAGFGAPHIRQRLWFLAHANGSSKYQGMPWAGQRTIEGYCAISLMEHAKSDGREQRRPEPVGRSDQPRREPIGLGDPALDRERTQHGESKQGEGLRVTLGGHGISGIVEHSFIPGLEGQSRDGDNGDESRRHGEATFRSASEAGATRGFWGGSDWVLTWPVRVGDNPSLRPVESRTFPLAHGAPGRVGFLRGYGNAINGEVAAEFLRAAMDVIAAPRTQEEEG